MCESGRRRRLRGAVALGLFLGLVAAPSSAQSVIGTGAFPKVAALGTELRRGISTKADVQRILGLPSGTGGALLPGFADRSSQLDAYQVWYYEDIELTGAESGGDVMTMKMRQQILMVFFTGEVFHGYFWTSNSGSPEFRR
jgi:hypothetical protein